MREEKRDIYKYSAIITSAYNFLLFLSVLSYHPCSPSICSNREHTSYDRIDEDGVTVSESCISNEEDDVV